MQRPPDDPEAVALALALTLRRCESLEETLTRERRRHSEVCSNVGWIGAALCAAYFIALGASMEPLSIIVNAAGTVCCGGVALLNLRQRAGGS